MLINAAISAGFFLVMFGHLDNIPAWGLGGYAMDFLPQSLAVAFMGSLVPGQLVRRRVLRDTLWPEPGPTSAGVLVRAALIAAGSLVVLGGTAAICVLLFAPSEIGSGVGFMIKVAFGALVSAIATPIAVMGVLRSPRGGPAS